MRRIVPILAALVALAALGASPVASAEPKPAPPRIVALNGDLAEIVWSLGLGNRVVGTDISATYPAAARRTPKIGYQRTLNAEAILALRPTVIIGNRDAGPPAAIRSLKAARKRVVIIPDDATLRSPAAKIRAVAKALGVTARGEALARRVEAGIGQATALAARATKQPRVAFLYVRGPQLLMIGGIGSRADSLIKGARGIDAGAEAGIRGFQPLTPEAMVAANPDVLLFLSAGLRSIGGVAGALKLPGVALTTAGRERRILAYDDQFLLGLGPRTPLALATLIGGLHPDLDTAG